MKKAIIILGLVVGLVIGSLYATSNVFKEAITDNQPQSKTELQPAAPQTIVIPKLEISSYVEKVGMDSKGNMDVPKDYQNTAWFEPGYFPGQQGNAVIAGHFDTPSGAPGVFYKLSSLQPNDEVIVKDEQGNEQKFIVVDKQTYPENNFPIDKVFGKTNKKMLNLITCDGVWDGQTYSQRLVIFTEKAS